MNLPVSLNWASSLNPIGAPVLSPVRNQGICGACWSFVAVGAVEASIRIKMGAYLSLSMQELLDCDRKTNRGCSGGDPTNGFRYITNNGLSLYEDYPYLEVDGICHTKLDKTRAYITGIVTVPPYSDISLQSALAYIGPVATGICGTDRSFMYYQSGIFSNMKCCTDQNHAVLIVGYGRDDDQGLNYWILQNSWGVLWGENGYMRILRTENGSPGLCGMDTLPSVPFGPYLINNEQDRLHENSTKLPPGSEFDRSQRWDDVNIWLARYWKSIAALVASALLTVSVLLLSYTVYIDWYLSNNIQHCMY